MRPVGKPRGGHDVRSFILAIFIMLSEPAVAGVNIAPYVSIKSTKSIKANKNDKSKEDETVKERREAGLRGTLTFFRLFGLQLGLGQSQVTTTQKTQDAVDEYGQIDFKKDLNTSTDDPASELKITETQRNARMSIVLDPSFGPFILRARAGVTATQRILVTEATGEEKSTKVFGPFYKPLSGFGAGIRITPGSYFMAEYNFLHYAFPKTTPFEREVAVTYAISL